MLARTWDTGFVEGAVTVYTGVIGYLLGVDLTLSADQPIAMLFPEGQNYVLKDFYVINRSGGPVDTGFIQIYTAALQNGEMVLGTSLSLPNSDSIVHTTGQGMDEFALSASVLYLSMQTPSNSGSLADIYLLGFPLY
jgi:hypothetical protein